MIDADYEHVWPPYNQPYQAPILAGSAAPIVPRPAPALPDPAALEGITLRTVDDHQTEQDRRLAVLEATIQEQNRRLAVLEHRLALLEDAEVRG